QETPGADAAKVITASPSRGAVNGSDRAGPPRSTTIVPGTETTAGRAAAWRAAAGWAAPVRGAPARGAPVRTSTAGRARLLMVGEPSPPGSRSGDGRIPRGRRVRVAPAPPERAAGAHPSGGRRVPAGGRDSG